MILDQADGKQRQNDDRCDDNDDKKVYIIKIKIKKCFPVELLTLQNYEEVLVEIEKSAKSTELTMGASKSIVIHEKSTEAKASEKTMDINTVHQYSHQGGKLL